MARRSSDTVKPVRTRRQTRGQTPLVDDDARREMIAEAAYFRAARRGFDGGDPIEDWLGAEQDIDEQLARRH